MRVVYRLVPVIALGVSTLTSAAAGSVSLSSIESGPLRLDPEAAVQGDFVVLRLDTQARAGTARVFGRGVPLFPIERGLRGIIPVSLRATPGRHAVEVSAGGRRTRVFLEVIRRDVGPVRRLPSLKVTSADTDSLKANRDVLRAAWRNVTAQAFWSAELRRPAPGRITAVFGTLRAYGGGASWPHRGADFSAPAGWPVIACAAGRVAMSRRLRVYGNIVIIDHGQTVFTAYMHLIHRAVSKGGRVEEGQVIGQAGATGLARGSHLHLGAYVGGVAVDPLNLLRRGLPVEEFRIQPPAEGGTR